MTSEVENAGGAACEVRNPADLGRDPLVGEGGSLIIVRVTLPSMVALVRQLLQENPLHPKAPWPLLVLAPENGPGQLPADLEQQAAQVLSWPEDAAKLAHLIERHEAPPGGGSRPADAVEAAWLAGQVLAPTPSLLPLADKLTLAAQRDVTVLLTGETGTGKTVLARAIHHLSPRSADRLVVVSCGASSRNLIEGELFGYVRGAFTGAEQDKAGKLAAAGNGTLLLDDVDALDLGQQAKLLRVVETGEYEPVGSARTCHTACRLLVTSTRNLEGEVEQGRFRVDLYYRLNVLAIHLPPLRERLADIASLAHAAVARARSKLGKDVQEISPEALAALQAYPWPGNIRELENAVEQAVVMSQGPVLLMSHLPKAIQEPNGHGPQTTERLALYSALTKHRHNRSQTAQAMGISRVTLYKKLKKYGLMGIPAANQG